MGTKYRVDRNTSHVRTPVGMNSLLYLGDDLREALRAFDRASTGIDPWNKPNPIYGVTLSAWIGSPRVGDYTVLYSKWPERPRQVATGTSYLDL